MSEDAMILRDVFAFVLGVVGIGCFTGIVTSWIKHRSKRLVSADVSARLGEIADRMSKLDNAVDAMAIEVERISEGQRFVTKVLAERGVTPSLADGQRGGSAPSAPRH
jgi:predicted TPR repeat methyltransferase